jgi:hypothetical protein
MRKVEGGERYTQGWVDAKKIRKAKFVQLLDFGNEYWEVVSKGMIKEVSDINTTFKNNYTTKFGNK